MPGSAVPVRAVVSLGLIVLVSACAPAAPSQPPADLLITNARVYTFAWDEPSAEVSSPNAPRDGTGWHPDAAAVAITGDRISFVGANDTGLQGREDAPGQFAGATLLPGFVDTHTHVVESASSCRASISRASRPRPKRSTRSPP